MKKLPLALILALILVAGGGAAWWYFDGGTAPGDGDTASDAQGSVLVAEVAEGSVRVVV
jgi:hypothetical protein